MTEIWLVRHGETDWNHEGRSQGHLPIPLNERGREQARAAARYLAEHGPWDAIISSSLLRASETAEIIRDATGVEAIALTKDLAERYHGAGQGCTGQEWRAFFPDGNVPGQESSEALQARVWRAMDAIVARLPDHRVVVVGHGGSIRQFLNRAEPSAEVGGLPNCSITKMVWADGRWRLVEARITEHLP